MDNFDYNLLTNPSNDLMSKLIIILGGFVILFAIIIIALIILLIVAKCKFYKKAGKRGWEAIIPFYSDWVLVEIAELNWWWFFILTASSIASILFDNSITTLAALATIFGSFVCHYNISKKLHKDIGFAILWTIFPVVIYPIVAFSKNYVYDKNVAVSKNGIFNN